MHNSFVSAIFDDQRAAGRAVDQLRSTGVPDTAISIIARSDSGKATTTDGAGEVQTRDVLGKAAAGAGMGALFGIAALAIPGVGPFIAAGAIAEAAVGGAAITGTAIGAAAGGLMGVLTSHGVEEDEARYYEERMTEGGIFVSVDADSAGMSPDHLRDILFGAGGYSSTSRASGTLA